MEENKDISTERLLKSVLILLLLERLKETHKEERCKEVEKALFQVIEELKTLRGMIKSEHLEETDINSLLQKVEVQLKLSEGELIEELRKTLKEHRNRVEAIIEERSEMVLDTLEEILRNNYRGLVDLINEIHGSLGVKLLAALIIFLAGVVVGSWIERFVLSKVVHTLQTELVNGRGK